MNSDFDIAFSGDGFGPSDHAAFYMQNIPVFYFSTGAHPDYHTPEDIASKINYAGIKKIADYAIIANKEMWNFDIWGYHDSLQYTRYYGNGGHYDWHADLGPGLSNRKLSVVLQLSDPSEYEGGDLEINPGGNIMTVPKEMGLICFFPSFLLHRVTPLTSGNRITLVTWLCGANLR